MSKGSDDVLILILVMFGIIGVPLFLFTICSLIVANNADRKSGYKD
jgi:hypothetical protein